MTLATGRDLRREMPEPAEVGAFGRRWVSDPPGVWEVTRRDEGVDTWTQIEQLPGPQARAMGEALLAAGEET